MLDTPQIMQTAAQRTALIRLVVPRTEIRTVMGPGLTELRAAVAAQGVAVTGPWFTYHFHIPTDVFDFAIGVPVAAPVSAAGRMQPGALPATTVARTVYNGPYEGLAAEWGELHTWIAANGYAPAQELWECYATGPESSPDPGTWRTELNQPVIRS